MDALASSVDIIAKIQTVPGTTGREEFFFNNVSMIKLACIFRRSVV